MKITKIYTMTIINSIFKNKKTNVFYNKKQAKL